MKYTIDAQGKKLGRVASEAAKALMGKLLPSYSRNNVPQVEVHITNVSKASIDEKKKDTKEYVTYTGYRGGLNTETLGALMDRKGVTEAFKRAVYRMLPINSLRSKMIKNLTITE